MQKYYFYIEHAGRHVSQQYKTPDDVIQAIDQDTAMRRFARKHKMRLSGWEPLIGEGWRAYYMSKGIEHVYYIEEAP